LQESLHPAQPWRTDHRWDPTGARANRLGGARLYFERFPFFPGEALQVGFRGKGDFSAFDRITIRLLFQEERGGRRRSSWTLYESETTLIPGKDVPRETRQLNLSLPIPDNGFVTRLSGDPRRYWMLEVRREISGKALRSSFLVPIYARPEIPGSRRKAGRGREAA